MLNIKFQRYLLRKVKDLVISSQFEREIRLGSLIKWISIQKSSKNPKGPIEAYKKAWEFLGYHKINVWASIGVKRSKKCK